MTTYPIEIVQNIASHDLIKIKSIKSEKRAISSRPINNNELQFISTFRGKWYAAYTILTLTTI